MTEKDIRRALTAAAVARLGPAAGSRRGRRGLRVLAKDIDAAFERQMGRKGGTSANAGRKANVYTFTFPDGTTGRKRSYQVDQAEAFAMVYQHQGVWYVSAIKGQPQNWPGQQAVPAVRK